MTYPNEKQTQLVSQAMKFKNRFSHFNRIQLQSKLEKKGLVGTFMDTYSDFLVFECPENLSLLKDLLYEIVQSNRFANFKNQTMLIPFFDIILIKVVAAS